MTAASQPEPMVLRAPRLLDGTAAPMVTDAALWLDGARIAWVGPGADLPAAAAGARAVDLAGCTLLPGLVDAHVHLVASGAPELAAGIPPTEAERTLAAIANCRRQLDGGTTLVRDLGAPGGEVAALARAIEAGTVEGPSVIAAGPAVTMTGGHIAYMGRIADGAEQMRTAIRANAALGAGCIKVVATGGVLTKGLDPRAAAYTQAELDALVDEAHRFGLRVAAHAIGEGGVAAALRAGVDSVEHGMFLDQTCIDLFVETGARLSATFSAPSCIIHGQSVPEWIKERARPAAEAQVASFKAAVDAGVRVVAGTDAGTPENYHGRVSHEVVAMVEAGLGVLGGVRAATAEAADLLGDPDRGVLRAGAVADVLAVEGDVLADVRALTRPAAVFKSGRQVRWTLPPRAGQRPPTAPGARWLG